MFVHVRFLVFAGFRWFSCQYITAYLGAISLFRGNWDGMVVTTIATDSRCTRIARDYARITGIAAVTSAQATIAALQRTEQAIEKLRNFDLGFFRGIE